MSASQSLDTVYHHIKYHCKSVCQTCYCATLHLLIRGSVHCSKIVRNQTPIAQKAQCSQNTASNVIFFHPHSTKPRPTLPQCLVRGRAGVSLWNMARKKMTQGGSLISEQWCLFDLTGWTFFWTIKILNDGPLDQWHGTLIITMTSVMCMESKVSINRLQAFF